MIDDIAHAMTTRRTPPAHSVPSLPLSLLNATALSRLRTPSAPSSQPWELVGHAVWITCEQPAITLGGGEAKPTIANQWREGKFCDVQVRVDNSVYDAHRLVLSAGSTFMNDAGGEES